MDNSVIQVPKVQPDSSYTTAILDRAVIVQFLRPTPYIKDIEMYIKKVFMNYIVTMYYKGYI